MKKPLLHHFNFRVVMSKEGKYDWFTIREVHYDKQNKPIGWTGPMEPSGENFEDVVADLDMMIEALKKPVLSEVKTKRGKEYSYRMVPWKRPRK